MNVHTPPEAAAGAPPAISPGMTLLLAAASGVCVANLYYAQPLTGLIGPDVGLPPDATGLIVTLAQLGYAAGLILIVPLGDRLENRRLIVATILATAVAMLGMTVATSGAALLLASAAIGLTAVVTQMIVPFAAHLAPERTRGQVVGYVMSGLVVGILLARPIASGLAHLLGSWRTVFALAAGLMAVLAACLARALPRRMPEGGQGYGEILRSMMPLLSTYPPLRRRMAYQASAFGGFSLFWTAIPFALSEPPFSFTQAGLAVFALVGASGVLVAPVAGWAADRGHGGALTGLSLACTGGGFTIGWIGRDSVVALAVAAILIDMAVQLSLVIGLRTIFSLNPAMRSRLHGLFMAGFFLAGAVASALASPLFHRGGWPAVSLLGLALPAAAALVFAREVRREPTGPRRPGL